MIAIAVDDEPLMLGALAKAIGSSEDITGVMKFSDCEEVIEFFKNNDADIAFLDINMRGMGGLSLAEKIINLCPKCRIVFCTGYEEYAIPAFKLHASGYLLKPISVADVQGEIYGNVLLRKAQFSAVMDESSSLSLAKGFILGKVYNSRLVLERAIRDHGLRIDSERVKAASARLAASLFEIQSCESFERLRGVEGDAAATYYSVFDELILNGDEFFSFVGRS
jgi:CRISPR/Cas system-associated endonuclease Cas1